MIVQTKHAIQPQRYGLLLLLCTFVVMMCVVARPALGGQDLKTASREAWTNYTAAQKAWQEGLAALTIRKAPEFKAVAEAQRDLQLGFIERRAARFEYLIDHAPDRIVVTEGLSRFSNFDWTDADTEALLADKNYAALEARVAALKKANDSQTNWEAFRTYFREHLSQDAEYTALFSEFMRRRAEVEAFLKEIS